jgi:hypothetical protein
VTLAASPEGQAQAGHVRPPPGVPVAGAGAACTGG